MSPDASLSGRVRAVTEQSLRAGAPPQMRFRGVVVYPQANAQHMAVCGQLDPFSDNPDIFVPFVSVVTLPKDVGDSSAYRFEHHVGTNSSEASRVYAAIVTYCYEGGGPPAGVDPATLPAPPLPDTIPAPNTDQAARNRLTVQSPAAAPAPAAVTPPPLADQVAASGSVTMRQNGNLHSDPHGPTIRVVPQGTPMKVFAQAPGGWYEVGDAAPWGWVHESLLDRH